MTSQLIDVGGYRLNFNVARGSSPTVIFEAGGRLRRVGFPSAVPCMVVAAERPPVERPEELENWKRVQKEFVLAAPNRRLMIARGSTHLVARDTPGLPIEAICDFATRSLPAARRRSQDCSNPPAHLNRSFTQGVT